VWRMIWPLHEPIRRGIVTNHHASATYQLVREQLVTEMLSALFNGVRQEFYEVLQFLSKFGDFADRQPQFAPQCIDHQMCFSPEAAAFRCQMNIYPPFINPVSFTNYQSLLLEPL